MDIHTDGRMNMNQIQKVINPMQKPHIEKVVVNLSVGKSGEALQKAIQVLEELTNKKPCQRLAKKSVRDWGIRKNEPIACIVTLRGQNAIDFLKRAFNAVENKLSPSCIDVNGNFSFGIKEHIEIPGIKYDPELGIFGMDICVTIEMPGYRIKRRHKLKSKVGKTQKVTPEMTRDYISELFNIEIQGGLVK